LAGVQTMITPLDKYYASENELIEDFQKLVKEVENTNKETDLFILPETYFLYDVNNYPNTVDMLEQTSKESSMSIVVPHIYENGDGYYNAVQLVSPNKGVGEEFYGKIELNPFTEYLPFENLLQVFSFLKFRNYLNKGETYTTFKIEMFSSI
jgi:apolipoprotein N-acyltransferase